MKIQLSESGHVEEWKPLEEIDVSFGITNESLDNENIYFLGIKKNSKIGKLLNENDEKNDFKIYFFRNILYLIFKNEKSYYTIRMYDNNLEKIKEQILKNKRILFFIYTEKQQLENAYIYDIFI